MNHATDQTTGKMYCYLFEDTAMKGQSKFGDTFVVNGNDPETAVHKRIRQQFDTSKQRYEKDCTIISWWDVSSIATKVGKNKPHGKIDDYLRALIGYRSANTGDWHMLTGQEMKLKVNQLLIKLDQTPIDVELSTKQYEVAEEVIEMFDDGAQVVLAELCARFGKTLWSAAVAVEMNTDIIVVASYVKTVFASFATDLTSFNQFSQYRHVDCSDDDYQTEIDDALANGQKVIAYLSLANGIKRQGRIDYLFGQDVETMLIVDEADFGAHTKKQAEPLIEAVGDDVKTILMTGTNSDRAVTHWKIDRMVSVTYPELLIQRRETEELAA